MGVVLVTVGTTKFDKLIQSIDTPAFCDTLARKGYTKLLIQKGSGTYLPKTLVPHGDKATLPSGFQVEYFEFTPSLAAFISSAALVISHAGSGSIFETLMVGKPLIVVPNSDLMDNHQVDLGGKLSSMQHLVSAYPDQLIQAVEQLSTGALKKYAKGDTGGIIKQIDTLLGVV